MQSIAQGVGRPAQVQAGIAVQVQVGTAAHMQGQIAVAMTGMCFLDLRPAHLLQTWVKMKTKLIFLTLLA